MKVHKPTLITSLLIALSWNGFAYGQTESNESSNIWASQFNSSAEAAFARFSGNQQTSNLFALALSSTTTSTSDSGSTFASQINASGTVIDSTAPNSYGVETKTRERRSSIALTGVINKLTTIGTSFGYTIIDKASKWSSLRIGHWWNKATISTDLEILSTQANKTSRDYLDTDGKRVITPTDVKSKRYTLSTTWLATTRAMLLGSVSQGTSSDRPQSLAETLEGRYFFDSTLTAVHVKVGHYADLHGVDKTTDYGRITANEWELQLHQHLSDQWIGSVIAREHFEVEEARSSETSDIHRHGRSSQGRLRYRFVTGPVTDSVSEIYVFTGKYNSIDTKQSMSHVGMGGIYVF